MKIKDFVKTIVLPLKNLEFDKKKYLFVKRLNDNIFGTLGFVIATHQKAGSLLVNPVLGIFNKSIEDLYSRLTGNQTINTYQPTISSPIGYLFPSTQYKEWEYNDDIDTNLINQDLLSSIVQYGIPFFEKYKQDGELLKCLEEGKYILNYVRDYKLPILYYLLGDKNKGLEVITESLNRFKKPFIKEDLIKLSTNEEMTIVGQGYGKVKPAYLKFIDGYNQL
jgi:hypothetical protein